MIEVTRLIKRLLIEEPFYGTLAMSLLKKEASTTSIGYVNGELTLSVNLEELNQLPYNYQLGLIQHQLIHLALFHLEYWDDLKSEPLLNTAMDMEVHSYLPENRRDPNSEIEQLFSQTGWDRRLGTKRYLELLKQSNNAPNTPGHNFCDDNSQQSMGGNSNDSDEDQGNDQQSNQDSDSNSNSSNSNIPNNINNIDKENIKRLIEGDIKSLLENTVKASDMRGTLPGVLDRYIEKSNKSYSEIPWQVFLKRCLGTAVSCNKKKGFRRESPRFEDFFKNRMLKKVEIIIAIDTSGSVDAQLLQMFMSEVYDFYKKQNAHIELVYADTHIRHKEILSDKTNLSQAPGGGGTSFIDVINYFTKSHAQLLIYFTDGYGDQDSISDNIRNKLRCRTLWVLPPKGGYTENLPGKVLYLKSNNQN